MINQILDIKIGDLIISNNMIIAGSIIISLIILFALIPKNKTKQEKVRNAPQNDKMLLGKQKLEELDPNLDVEKFRDTCYEIFKNITNSYTKQDLNDIKKLASNKVYKEYEKDINILKSKDYKHNIEKMEFMDFYIVNVKLNQNKEYINTRMIINCYDYITDGTTKIIKGDYKNKHMFTYDLTFSKGINNENWKLEDKQLLYERKI